MENLDGIMTINMKDNFLKIKFKVKELLNITMEISMREIGETMHKMDKGFLNGLMAIFIQGNFFILKNMVKE